MRKHYACTFLLALNLSLTILFLAASITAQGVRQTNSAPQVKSNPKRQTNSQTSTRRNAAAINKASAAKIEVREIDDAALRKLLQVGAAENVGPLLVNFWATWCEPCRDEFPDLIKLDAEYRPRGLRFITVSLDDIAEINTSVLQFLREMHMDAPAFLLNTSDPSVSIGAIDPQRADAAAGLPVTFLFDKRGQVVFRHMGRIKLAEVRAAIEKVISNE
ncbi:MAG: TlpA family protein disulfide reductase [Pyrinomonadaceae bacterium]|nr:TlpA family protein disulfide reductase [Pyrinomonadaceae bacterium]